jgi:hypothetical protein
MDMAQPRVPGEPVGDDLQLPCGETIDVQELDLGMRELTCDCGETHAVVMDVHPPTRFLPDFLVETLRETIDTDDGFEEFGTPHLLGTLREERPADIVSHDASEDGTVGFGLLWIVDDDPRTLHEAIVDLVVELMEHAIGHVDDDSLLSEFEAELRSFDTAEFVAEYRTQREFESEHDRPV